MLNKLKNLFSKKTNSDPVKEAAPVVKRVKVKQEKAEPSEKDKATAAGEPYVSILRVDIDPNNINNGAFELDWNDKFLLNLIKAGYKLKEDDKDNVIIDRWFQTVCRNIALEVYEQEQADPANREFIRPISTRDIGGGRTEVS
jgi:hypothetical protein